MKFDSKVYDVLKALAQIYIPALGTLYFALAQIWHLPAAEEVTGTVVAVDAFLGVILGISSSSYNKSEERFDGEMIGHATPSGVTYTLSLNEGPEALASKDELSLKITPPVS